MQQDMARHGGRHGEARQAKARRGTARRGTALHRSITPRSTLQNSRRGAARHSSAVAQRGKRGTTRRETRRKQRGAGLWGVQWRVTISSPRLPDSHEQHTSTTFRVTIGMITADRGARGPDRSHCASRTQRENSASEASRTPGITRLSCPPLSSYILVTCQPPH